MSAILLGQKALENPFEIEDTEIIAKKEEREEREEKDEKEKIIEGKNKTYVISKTLGKGTFGKVKLAYNKDNKNEKYACKILLKSNIKDEDDYMRCKREMDILKKMHHVNVVRTYEIISTETTYYIFMDFCAKGELFNYIVEKQHLSEEKSAFFYYQLINGIEYIHKKGVCHRDLKPENLLLTEKNKLKIIDFGLSNYFKGNLLETPCGSPCYASPEMVMGNKYNGFCIDIWSSGIILYAMLCGYLPFEEMENDEYNEVLFRNIVECNVEYPSEFVTPVAKDLLCKILVKDPRKRITIEEIKLHNFYLLGELLYKQTFENMGSINDYLFLVDDKEKFIDYEDLKDKDIEEIVLNNNYLNLNDKILKKYQEYEKELELLNEKESNKKDKNKNKDKSRHKNDNNADLILEVKNSDNDRITTEKNENENENENNNITPISLSNTDKKKDKDNKKKDEKDTETKNNEKIEKTEKNKKNNSAEKEKQSNMVQKKEEIHEDTNAKEKDNKKKKEKKKSPKKAKSRELFESKDEQKKATIKQLSLETYHNIQIPINNHIEKKYKGNILQNSLKIKKSKTNKDEKSLKEYSIQDDYTNNNKNSNDINIKTQYLKTEIYPSNSKNKTKTKKSHYQCKLLNKKLVNNNKTAFDNILKSLQNKTNTTKSKTPKRYSAKKNIPIKQNSNQSNSTMRRKYCSYSPGIRKVSKDGMNIINNIDKNINFHRKTNNNNTIKKNTYNLLSDNVLKFFCNSNFYFNYENRNKNFKPNKKFVQKKNDKNTINNTNNINSIMNDNYFRTNNNIKSKNNDEKKLFQSSMNNPLNRKSFDYCLSSNTSKKKHLVVDKKINNNINNNNKNNFNYLLTNNFNIAKTTKNNISKKSFGNLKGNNYLNNLFSDNSKPILINTSHIRKNVCNTTTNDKTNQIINKKNNNSHNKTNSISNRKSKSKSKNKKNNILLNKKNNLYNKDNLDNNIIINVNFLKPNIIVDHQRASSRKTKNSRPALNPNMTTGAHNNHFITSKVERPVTESNFCSTVRNNYFNRSNKNKNNNNNFKNYNNNYKNIDMKQIKNSKEINQIIKSIQEMNKNQTTYNNINSNKKRMNTEI